MRRNVIKVTDEIKEGGRNEDTEDFFLFSPLQNQKHWGSKEIEKQRGKNSSQFLFSSQKSTSKCSIQLKFLFPRPFGALLRVGLSHLQFQQRITQTQRYEDRKNAVNIHFCYRYFGPMFLASIFRLLMSFVGTCCFSC